MVWNHETPAEDSTFYAARRAIPANRKPLYSARIHIIDLDTRRCFGGFLEIRLTIARNKPTSEISPVVAVVLGVAENDLQLAFIDPLRRS